MIYTYQTANRVAKYMIKAKIGSLPIIKEPLYYIVLRT